MYLPKCHSKTTQQVPTKLIRQYQEGLPVLQGNLLFQRIQYWVPCCQLKAAKNKIRIRVNRPKIWKFIDKIFTLTKNKLIATATIRNSDLPTNFAIKDIEPGSFEFLIISNSQPFILDALVSDLLSVISKTFLLFRTFFEHTVLPLLAVFLQPPLKRMKEEILLACSKENITTITVHLQTQ